MRKSVSLLLILALVFCLAACGGKKANDPEGAEQPTVEPVAAVDPNDIEWGYEASGLSDTQHWYADGQKSQTDYIFFEDDSITVIKGGEATELAAEIADMHLVDTKTGGQTHDFTFSDYFTCYDAVSKTQYKRCDYDAFVASLTAAELVNEVDAAWTLTFNADGTMSYNHNNEPHVGTWWMEDARTIHYHFDDEADDQGGYFDVVYSEADWTVDHVADMDAYYPAS